MKGATVVWVESAEQELASIWMIYTHVLNRDDVKIVSPLDRMGSKIKEDHSNSESTQPEVIDQPAALPTPILREGEGSVALPSASSSRHEVKRWTDMDLIVAHGASHAREVTACSTSDSTTLNE